MAKVYFYYSAMNAGKSTMLLQSSHNYRERGMDTLLFTPALDNRYAYGSIHSRIGLEAQALPFGDEFDFFKFTKQHVAKTTNKMSCILIDEAQFLTKQQVHQLTEIADQLHIPVLTYGLRSDFLGEPFEGSKYLLAWAEEIMEIKTICHCGSKALMNMRINSKGEMVTAGEQIQIGGNESYVSTCRKHFRLGMPRPDSPPLTNESVSTEKDTAFS